MFAALVQLAGAGMMDQVLVRDSLSRVHPRMRASWLREHGLDDSYYTTFQRPESTGLACVGRWPWGPSWELCGRDTFLYLGSGSGVRILSISDSVHPRMLGQINARSLVSQVVVQDSLLFVACGSWGAQIYSVADPAYPREVGSMDAVIGDLCAKDIFCYAVGGGSFRIYDVADPTQPTQVGAITDSGDVIEVANGHVFIGGPGPMNVYDVTDPAHPTLVNSLGGPTYDMYVRRNLLFCTMGASPTRFSILNITDPLNITEVSRLSGYAGDGVYANDSFAFVSCIRDHVGLFVVDVSDSSRPSLRDSINPEGVVEWQPYAPSPNSYGYLADDYGGLITLDLHDANSISEVWSGYKAHEAVDIVIDGHRAYVADQCSGLQIVDVADPTRPASLGIFDTVGSKITYTATARDSFAFSAMSGMSGRRDLLSLSVLDPTNPVLVAQESCFNPPQDVVLRDTFIYAAESYEFQVFNVARPREPVLVGSCDGDGVAVVVQDSFAYTAAGAIRITNVSRSDSPFVVSTISGHNATGVAVRDTFLYIPYVYDTLFTYSTADPAHPRLLSSTRVGVWPSDVVLGDERGYVALNGAEGVEVLDLTNPGYPVSRGQTSAPYAVRRLCYSNGLVYAAMWEAGVAIYETTVIGIHEQTSIAEESRGLRVWPSVTVGDVRFMVGPAGRSSDIGVYDISGKRLRDVRLQTELKGGTAEGVIDLAGLAAGVYVVRVESEGKNLTTKVVKTNRR
jgi:hypothetical protein